jgi:hypothetical protein
MTLTEVNFYVRRMAPLVAIFLLVLLTLFFGIRLIFKILEGQSGPPVGPTAAPIILNPAFNQIKPPAIPGAQPSANFTYVLDTLDGTANIAEATPAAVVYFIPKDAPTFGFLNDIYAMAKAAGFDTELTKHVVQDRIAEFNDGKRKLSINIDTFNFNFDYTITPEDGSFDDTFIPAESNLQSTATNFFDKMNTYPPELAQGKRNYIYLKFDAGTKQISALENPIGANMVEIDFFQPDLHGRPIVSSSFYNSPNYIVLAFEKSGMKVIRAQTRLFPRSKDQVGMYPLKSGQEAWEDLKKGNGYVVSAGQQNGEMIIKKIVLAYYDPDIYQEYLQPVYVFLGDNKFAAYVPAVTDQYLAK